MKDRRTHRPRNENLKTQSNVKPSEVQMGKMVRLPYIRKISQQQPSSLERSENRVLRSSHKELGLLQHAHMLTLQEIELCKDSSLEKDRFPQIRPMNPLLRRQHSIESLECSLRNNRDRKSLTKGDFLGDKIKDYKLGPVIAKGTYSVVRTATHALSGKKVAVKTYLKTSLSNQDRIRNLEQQLQVLAQLQNPLILQLHEYVEAENSVSIITELLQNRSLGDYLKGQSCQGVSEDIAKFIVKQLIKAVAYCHSLNIVHRDLKPENVLISRQFKVKLIDFGFSLILPSENHILYDYCGTPNYIAPEVTQREGYYGKPADVWSLGIIIYRMVVGSFPNRPSESKPIRIPGEISNQLSGLLAQMLSFDFWKRPSVEEILACEWLAR